MPNDTSHKYLDYLRSLSEGLREASFIPPEAYNNQDIKRGLRNSDGTGVAAGISSIGNVHGYVLDEGERVPVEGRLTYRGINVADLLKSYDDEDRFGFEETAFLLLAGKLPTGAELKQFNIMLGELRALPDSFTEDMIIKNPSSNVMNALARSTLALYSYDDYPDDLTLLNNMRQGVELVARFPTIISHAYRVKKHYFDRESLVLRYIDPEFSTAQNILMLVRKNRNFTQEEARLLDSCLVLHAEHGGGNNSTFACRVLTSTGTDIYSASSAAVGSLKGYKHGGANIAVTNMFNEIKQNLPDWEDEDLLREYLLKILRREAGDGSGLIYGIGHAVYTLSDPRAVELKKRAGALAKEKGLESEFKLLEAIERAAKYVLGESGNEKVVCANVDFYSGFVYEMLGIPVDIITPIFAASRITGWIAHRLEELECSKIIRPAYRPMTRDVSFVPIDKR